MWLFFTIFFFFFPPYIILLCIGRILFHVPTSLRIVSRGNYNAVYRHRFFFFFIPRVSSAAVPADTVDAFSHAADSDDGAREREKTKHKKKKKWTEKKPKEKNKQKTYNLIRLHSAWNRILNYVLCTGRERQGAAQSRLVIDRCRKNRSSNFKQFQFHRCAFVLAAAATPPDVQRSDELLFVHIIAGVESFDRVTCRGRVYRTPVRNIPPSPYFGDGRKKNQEKKKRVMIIFLIMKKEHGNIFLTRLNRTEIDVW